MAGIQYQFAGTQPRNTTNLAPGSTRFNTTANRFEMWDGAGWQTVDAGWVQRESLAESIAQVADRIGVYIEEDHGDNPAIQAAYTEWLDATERFHVIASIAER